MTSLNISTNKMATKEAGRVLAQMLEANSVLKELDVSDNVLRHSYDGDRKTFDGADGPGFAQELANGIKNNGALETITFGDEQAVTMTADITEADFSSNNLGTPGAMIVAAFLPKCQ